MALIAGVVIDDIINRIDKPYDYLVPDRLRDEVKPGMRVLVPFSISNMKKKALVISIGSADESLQLKEILDVFDSEVLLDDLQLSLVKLLKTRYFITYYSALRAIVPRGIDFRISEKYYAQESLRDSSPALFELFSSRRSGLEKNDVPANMRLGFDEYVKTGLITKKVITAQNVGQLTNKLICLNVEPAEAERQAARLDRRFEKQRDLLYVLAENTELSEKDALYYSGCGKSTVRTLENKGLIRVEHRPVERNPYKELERQENLDTIQLTSEQNQVFSAVSSDAGHYATHLIHGVTGSGKTLVYMSLIDEMYKSRRSVIFMVPEISLTPQTLSRFYMRYGDRVAVVHSALSPGERADEWRKIKNSEFCVVVGTRSAVFAPAANLGLVVIDEEHEPSYKSESAPRYHARDIAKFICKKLDIPLVLGSATPSVESAYNAKNGRYKYHKLTLRYNNSPLPKTQIVDMRTVFKEGNQSFLSQDLREAIEKNLGSGEQTILFLNRRGTHTVVGCRSCGYVAKCPDCGVALTYHVANGRCMCHYCGYSIKMFDTCPKCESRHIKKLGLGTQLVDTELSELFPDARILRMDYDTVDSYIAYANKLNSFKNGEYNIMVGTQMVAKGLDFPNVTLVGVINADLSLYVDDFRANERTFSLLTQVCGRSGRAGKEGIAIIQTYCPEYETIRFAKEQDYDKYYDFEINFRRAMNYPPFCDLVQFTVSNKSESAAFRDISYLYKLIDGMSKSEFHDLPVRMLYPTTPMIAKFNDKYRYNLVIKSKICNRLFELLHIISSGFENDKLSEISININPISSV